MEMHADFAVKGGTRAAGNGQSSLQAYSIGVSETVTVGHGGNSLEYAGYLTKADGVNRGQASQMLSDSAKFMATSVYIVASAARKFWRSGKCVEVVVDPKGGSVGQDSTTTVTAKVRHRFEGGELDKPVEATVSGVKSIEPAGQKVPAPATFTYTAGSKQGDTGKVTFKSVSNRGIGETTVTFTVGGSWITEGHIAPTDFRGEKCNGLNGEWLIVGTIKGGGVTSSVRFSVTIDEKTLKGTYSYKSGTVTEISTGTVTGTGPASIVVQPDGSVVMTLGPTMATSTGTVAGHTETITLPLPGWGFTWTPSGACSKAAP